MLENHSEALLAADVEIERLIDLYFECKSVCNSLEISEWKKQSSWKIVGFYWFGVGITRMDVSSLCFVVCTITLCASNQTVVVIMKALDLTFLVQVQDTSGWDL